MSTFETVPELVARAAAQFGDLPAVFDGRRRLTFAELAVAVSRAAGSYGTLGPPGATDLLSARNSVGLVVAWLGAIDAGLIPAAVNPDLTISELRYIGGELEPCCVAVDAPEGAGSELAVEYGVPLVQVAQIEGAAPGKARPIDPLKTAAIVYTSGTTSRPKGVQVRHAAYTETGRSFPSWVGLRGEDVLWACLPLFHINAQAYSLMTALAHGMPLAVTDRFHATTFWADAAELGVTAVNVIGAMLTFLEAQPQSSFRESRLRLIYAAPAPAPEVRRRLQERFGVFITGGYGMSENTFGCAESPTSRDKAGSIGRPRQPVAATFENQLKIVTPDGRDAATGEPGELHFRNPVLTPGYWRAPEITSAALVDGWLKTGDLGVRDDDGDISLVGRSKEMIRRRGENISPAEVEDALAVHPAVAAVAVFGIPSPSTEEDVVAAVVLRPGFSAIASELQAFARERLAPFKVPTEIAFVADLPLTATARVARDRLRNEFLAARVKLTES